MPRIHSAAASALRRAIAANEGREVFAIGDVTGSMVSQLTVTCRGQEDRVPALVDRPRAGQVVIHNHPSGDLRPSDADLALASMYGEDGVGVVIVDNDVKRDNWVVEPYQRAPVSVDPEEVKAWFTDTLPTVVPGAETRDEQLRMALAVTRALNDEAPLLVEAGTGTGKSLAYLVPAALWARANEAQVAISTYTKALQGQLLRSDLPALRSLGVDYAVLQGRNNYLCKRRLRLAEQEEGDDDERAEVRALVDWARISTEGTRQDLPTPVDPAVWERVESDSDLSLKVRCPHYASCFFYTARRSAAAAHLVVVNHSLLLLDLELRAEQGRGVLPKYQRLILDEGHHLEEAATGVGSRTLSARAVHRAVSPLLSRPRRRGALERLFNEHIDRDDVLRALDQARGQLEEVDDTTAHVLAELSDQLEDGPRRLHGSWLETAAWKQDTGPQLATLADHLEAAAKALADLQDTFDDDTVAPSQAQPHLDVQRARKRLAGQAAVARAFAQHAPSGDDSTVDRLEEPLACRWFERARGRGPASAALIEAPIEVAPVLRRILWQALPGTVVTSATLTTAKRFDHLRRLIGLGSEGDELLLDSPFDHARQAVLALPRDLPAPSQPGYWEQTAQFIAQAITHSKGGAFVLCTSYHAVRTYAEALRQAGFEVLAQGDRSRIALLERFKEHENSVLVGTDSFWEGVSVKGRALRLVIVPRLPFRVPTDPLQQARAERIAARGGDPFSQLALPQAILKLRQGYGRLIRSRSDRGVVALLDRRLHERRYGRVILHSLPPARRIQGPSERVLLALAEAFSRF